MRNPIRTLFLAGALLLSALGIGAVGTATPAAAQSCTVQAYSYIWGPSVFARNDKVSGNCPSGYTTTFYFYRYGGCSGYHSRVSGNSGYDWTRLVGNKDFIRTVRIYVNGQGGYCQNVR